MPSFAIFQNNREILPTMRCKLVNWLIEVSLHFRLHRETLYLSIHYLDRFLTLNWGIPKQNLQLIGIACLFVAAKLEEIYPPKLKEFAEVCGGICTPQAIFETELEILMMVQWKLNFPTPHFWLNLYAELLWSDEHLSLKEFVSVRKEAMDILDIAIHTPIMLSFKYSILAASALYIRLQDEWLTMQSTEYTWPEIQPCVDLLWSLTGIPDYIIYYDSNDTVSEEEFDYAIESNTRAMNWLMEQIRLDDPPYLQ